MKGFFLWIWNLSREAEERQERSFERKAVLEDIRLYLEEKHIAHVVLKDNSPGVDIVLAYHGTAIAVQFVAVSEKQSQDQLDWMAEWHQFPSSGRVFVISSAFDLEKALDQVG